MDRPFLWVCRYKSAHVYAWQSNTHRLAESRLEWFRVLGKSANLICYTLFWLNLDLQVLVSLLVMKILVIKPIQLLSFGTGNSLPIFGISWVLLFFTSRNCTLRTQLRHHITNVYVEQCNSKYFCSLCFPSKLEGAEIDTLYSNALKATLFEVTTVWLTIFKLYAFRSCSCSTVNLCPMSFLDYLWKVSSSFVVVQDAFICPCSAK